MVALTIGRYEGRQGKVCQSISIVEIVENAIIIYNNATTHNDSLGRLQHITVQATSLHD